MQERERKNAQDNCMSVLFGVNSLSLLVFLLFIPALESVNPGWCSWLLR